MHVIFLLPLFSIAGLILLFSLLQYTDVAIEDYDRKFFGKISIISLIIICILTAWLISYNLQSPRISFVSVASPVNHYLPNGCYVQRIDFIDEDGEIHTEVLKYILPPGFKVKITQFKQGPYLGLYNKVEPVFSVIQSTK